jgi:hypothetical protein
MLDAATSGHGAFAHDDEAARLQSEAAAAASLLAQSELGISSITYVGLPERQAVHLAATTRARGLCPTLTRGGAGSASLAIRPAFLARILSDF